MEEVDQSLRNCLWSALHKHVWSQRFERRNATSMSKAVESLADFLWTEYFKLSIDERLPLDTQFQGRDTFVDWIKRRFMSSEWFKVYDILECVLEFKYSELFGGLQASLNSCLEKENAAYRIIDGRTVPITHEVEIVSVETAIAESEDTVAYHISEAIKSLSNRKSPDLRNSIKESISAVEAEIKVRCGKDWNGTFSSARKYLSDQIIGHSAFLRGMENLYGFTSDDQGIRHSLTDKPNLTKDDAAYFLVICSAFVNYLRASDV